MKKAAMILLASMAFLSCSGPKKTIDIKSPCVSTEDGPCGPKRSINNWWLENNA